MREMFVDITCKMLENWRRETWISGGIEEGNMGDFI